MTSADDLRARIDLFEQATSYAVDLLTTVGPTDLLRPTPCQGWDVGAVVLHLADAADAVIGWMATGRLSMPTPRALTTEMPVDVACERIDALSQMLTEGSGTVGIELLMGAAQGGATELAVHGWDIAAGIGLDRPVPAELASALFTLVDGKLDQAARGDNFAPAVSMAPAAPPGDRLLAYLGRRPGRRPGTSARHRVGTSIEADR